MKMTKQDIEFKIDHLIKEAQSLGIHYGCGCGCGGEALQADIEELEEMLEALQLDESSTTTTSSTK
ncbi:MAG: hypothetical protein RR959_08930 [Erysipelotrichaceae bacterium]